MQTLRAVHERFPEVFGEPRGLGLLLGLPVIAPGTAAAIVDSLRETAGVLANAAGGNTLRFAPPLIVTPEQIDRLATALARAAQDLEISETIEPVRAGSSVRATSA